jgi:hypothetical protein
MGIESQELPTESLRERLDNWVKERPIIAFTQRQVRRRIANAVITDLLDSEQSVNISNNVLKYRKHVNEALTKTFNKLENLSPQGKTEVVIKSLPQKDQQTGVVFITQMRRETNAWVSEELGMDDAPITRATLYDGEKDDELTLDFKNLDYKGANPSIRNGTKFPTGTKVLFLNHAASLGVISWDGK